MATDEKVLEKMKRNPKNTDERTFRKALKKYGFILDENRGKGGHQCYYHPKFSQISTRTVNFTKPMRPHIIKRLIEDIEEVTQ
ncbi:hypothetical protein BHM04_04830 [Macrococcus sp. IME1552]|nr:hypothetical protein [Macrococcus sp. IME1552]ATD30542.1 hypothetical protein BHM04_04830 [Macrococcus sp. IME1552]